MLKLMSLLLCLLPVFTWAYELEGVLHQQDYIQIEDEPPESVSQIEADEIETLKAGAASIDDILRVSPMATTARGPRSSGEAPQVRGLDQTKIFVMVDGARQNFQTGHNSMIGLDTENLKTVDIFTNSSSISESGSLGGGVNFVTKNANDLLQRGKKSGGEFKTRYASANAENSINAKYAIRDKNNSTYVSMSSTNAQNLQLNNGETLGFSSFQDRSVLFKNQIGKWNFKFEGFQREDNAPIDPTLNPPSRIRELFSENTITRTTLGVDYKRNGWEASAYYNGFSLEKQEVANSETKNRRINTYGVKVKRTQKNWTFGGEFFTDQLQSDLNGEEIESYPNARGSNTIAYGERNIEISEVHELTPGARMNAYALSSENNGANQSGSALSGALNLKSKWNSKVTTIVSLSQGYNSPRVNQVYPTGLHSPGDDFVIRDNFFIPNEDLRQETSLNREFRLRYQDNFAGGNGLVKFNFNAYENSLSDYIILQRIDRSVFDDQDGTTQFVNIDRASLYGGEVEVKILYDAIDSSLSYTKVRGRNESADLWLEDLPADQYNFKLNYYLDRYGLTLGYLGFYALEQNRVNPQTIQRTEQTPSYLVHNVFMRKKLKDFNIDFRVDNLSNQKYRRHASFLNEAREDYKLALTYKINTL